MSIKKSIKGWDSAAKKTFLEFSDVGDNGERARSLKVLLLVIGSIKCSK